MGCHSLYTLKGERGLTKVINHKRLPILVYKGYCRNETYFFSPQLTKHTEKGTDTELFQRPAPCPNSLGRSICFSH